MRKAAISGPIPEGCNFHWSHYSPQARQTDWLSKDRGGELTHSSGRQMQCTNHHDHMQHSHFVRPALTLQHHVPLAVAHMPRTQFKAPLLWLQQVQQHQFK